MYWGTGFVHVGFEYRDGRQISIMPRILPQMVCKMQVQTRSLMTHNVVRTVDVSVSGDISCKEKKKEMIMLGQTLRLAVKNGTEVLGIMVWKGKKEGRLHPE